MLKPLIIAAILIAPYPIIAETAMKCETGKCSAGSNESSKKIPEKTPSPSSKKALKEHKNKPTVEQLFNVTTTTVKRESTAKEQVNYGYIVAQDDAKVDVLTWYSGFIKELYADTLYKRVKKGDPLVKVYSPEVYKAKQDYLNSINYNRKTSMPEMLKSAQIKLKLLGVDKREIEAIRKERKADTYTTVYAPISGWIFEKNINEGASFNSKKRLFQIINIDKVWMEVKLFQNQLENLGKLEHYMVKVKGISETFMAEKTLLYPMLNPKEATATLRLTIDNKTQTLKPGMYAKVHASELSKSRLIIPRTAAIRKSGTWYAFLATEFKGEYEPVEIKIRPLDHKQFEVLSGLNENESIVNNALFMMDSDAQINGIY
ncbi:MAG: cation transporter [Sulfurovum sp.]|nr:MAG: cation transporter [Sulfurovum sp.]